MSDSSSTALPAGQPVPELSAQLPPMWVGYLLAVLFFLGEVYVVATDPQFVERGGGSGLLLLLTVAGWFYWLYCVYKFHDVLMQVPGYEHPITPWRAVAMHWIPLYNFYWVFKWPSEMATFVNWRRQSDSMHGASAGVPVLLGFLAMRFFDGALGFAILFTAGIYICRQLHLAFSAPPVPAEAMAPPGVKGILGLSSRPPIRL